MAPITGDSTIIQPSRSVRSRAVAAGVIRRASTRMLPIVWSEMTTARVTPT